MAGRGPAPKEQRRRRNVPARGEWMDLPVEGRRGRTPKWPIGKCTPSERGLWQRVWRTPQATQWESMGLATEVQVARWVRMTLNDNLRGDDAAQLRLLERELGIGPAGLKDQRWRIGPPEAADQETPATVTAMDTYRSMAG